MAMLFLSMPILVFSQGKKLSGQVVDENRQALPGCHIHYENHFSITDTNGHFTLDHIKKEKVQLQFSFVGYNQLDTLVDVSSNNIVIKLEPEHELIQQIKIQGRRETHAGALKYETLNEHFLTRTQSGTFIQSLNQLSGINSMDIGSNSSKPVIRGMSLNRVTVSESGIKQEGQQWGADHGLEIDPFAIETAEVVKGPSAIEYGSDAIGGYINIVNNLVPPPGQTKGNIHLLTKSVNNLMGISANFETHRNLFYFKARGTLLDFSDYHIPTDTIIYLSRKIPVVDQKLKNTAGKEYDFSGQVGLLTNRMKSTLSASRVEQKSGFFPGSHGIPDLSRVQDDHNNRNIEYPFQETVHYKLISNTSYHSVRTLYQADLAFQDNDRSEWSQFHTHYSGQTAPAINPDLELNFHLKTYQANFKINWHDLSNHSLSIGLQNQWKRNTIDGYNFFLPEYTNYTAGLFAKDAYQLSERFTIHVGLRYDLSQTNIDTYYDPILENYLLSSGSSQEEAQDYATRSIATNRRFHDFSWLIGFVFTPPGNLITRFNMGKAFRTPTPIELSANGIHHGSFRHEQGDNQLSAEKGYYADAGLEWKNEGFQLEINPYAYYFSNYLYLNPTGEWSKLPHAGQIYRYSESKAILSGIEVSFLKHFWHNLEVHLNAEYIRNEQISDNSNERYPLPFTPPANFFVEFQYEINSSSQTFQETNFFVHCKSSFDQNRVARNEQNTPGYQVFGMGINSTINWGKNTFELVLQANNIFDSKYFNHLSFYRKLEIPEPGRNIQLLIKIPF